MAFADYQLEIYFKGLSGVLPPLPMAFAELEAKAEAAMSPSMWSYVAGGSGDEQTQRINVTAFDGWGLMPRMFVGANDRDLSVNLFGMTLPSPVMMAPVGVIGLCAQDGHGDLATARAAARTGVPMIASTMSADPMEEVAAEFGDTPGFFQLYTPKDRDLAASLVHRAPRRPASRASSSRWTPGYRAGALATCPPRTSRSCAASAWPTTPATRCSAQACKRRPRKIRRPRCCSGSRSSETR